MIEHVNAVNNNHNKRKTEDLLLTLGILSFVLYPITAIPGIIIGRKQFDRSLKGKIGYQ